MITLRPSLKDDILRELDNTSFGKDLFVLEFQKNDYLINVSFIPNSAFSFKAKEVQNNSNPREQYLSIEAPGQWTLEPEEFQHESFGHARGRITSWALRIEADFKSSQPIDENFEKLRDEIISQFDHYNQNGGNHFSEEEKSTIHSSIDELKEKMEKLYTEKDATNQQLNIMRQQINKLTESIEILDKRTWVLAAANRVINIFKEVKAAVGEVQALTSDINKLIPQETETPED